MGEVQIYELPIKEKKMAKTTPKGLGEGAVREIVDGMLRAAFRDQARDLEKHFKDVDTRLRTLERKRANQ
jgi:hypothetical protein